MAGLNGSDLAQARDGDRAGSAASRHAIGRDAQFAGRGAVTHLAPAVVAPTEDGSGAGEGTTMSSARGDGFHRR